MPEQLSVSVYKNSADYFFLRFLLRTSHLQEIGKPSRLAIRGQPANGFIIAPDKKGLRTSKVGKDGHYLQTTLTKIELSKRERKSVQLMPALENGHIRVPPLPEAWIHGEEFAPGVYSERTKQAKVSAFPGDDPVRIASTTAVMSQPHGVTSPLPKPQGQVYQIPADASIQALQAELAMKLAEARIIVAEIEQRTGLRLVLDRHFRLQVALT